MGHTWTWWLGCCGNFLLKYWLAVGVNQKTAFYTEECQLLWMNGLRAPRTVLLIVDSSLEIEVVVPAFWFEGMYFLLGIVAVVGN